MNGQPYRPPEPPIEQLARALLQLRRWHAQIARDVTARIKTEEDS